MNYVRQYVEGIKQSLETVGIAFDEESGLGTKAFEVDADKLKADLRSLGLDGDIDTGAHNRKGGSTFYWMSYELSYDQAKSLAKQWAAANPD